MKFTFEPESRPLDGYTIKRAIHRGGFGEVYYAISDAGKEVALKLLQQNLEVELRGISQCLNLKHSNLVTIFDVKEDGDGDFWVVMEFVGGKTLSQEIHQHRDGMRMEEVRHWLTGIVNGVTYLHDRGIVHRDIKPANIFSEDGVVKVGDVGLSKFISNTRRSAHTQSVGTVYYMAPEVANGRYGKEVDVYATGIILFEMITGRVPFDGESAGEILMKHLSEEPDLSALPDRIRPVVERALRKDPEQRTPSMERLLAEFNAAVIGAPLPDSPKVAAENVNATTAPRNEQKYQRTSTEPQAANARPYSENAESPVGFWAIFQDWMQKWGWAVVIAILLFGTGFWSGVIRLGLIGIMTFGIVYAIIRAYEYIQQTSVSHWGEVPDRPHRPHARPHHAAGQYRAPTYQTIPYSPDTPRRLSLLLRANQTLTSCCYAVLTTVMITAGLVLVSPSMFGIKQSMPLGTAISEPVFFASIAALACCGMIVLGKSLEGCELDVYSRRLLQLALGLLVGAAAFHLANYLMIDFSAKGDTNDGGFNYIGHFRLVDHRQPTMAGFMTLFGLMFMFRRWRWHTDSFRPNRFRIWSVIGTLAVTMMIIVLFSFQPVWALTWAATISSSVQLASSWVPEERRRAIVEGGA